MFCFPDIFFESLYRYNYVCWLRSPSLVWGFLFPLGLLLFLNYVVFILLWKTTVWRKRKVCLLKYFSLFGYAL